MEYTGCNATCCGENCCCSCMPINAPDIEAVLQHQEAESKTYTVELTAPQLRILLEMASCHEFYKLGKGLGSHTKEEADVFMKVSDAMEQYYNDNGITE
jgi:hypothetical protein